MKTKRNLILMTTVVAFALLATFGIVRNFQKVEAFNPQPDPPGFGMVGITQGQTVRITVVNTAPAPDPDFPPDPCRVVITFKDSDGAFFRNGDGNIIRRIALLKGGESTSLDLDGDNFSRTADRTGRIQLRPVVSIQQPNGNNNIPPDPVIPAAEVFNNGNGRTQFVMSALPAVQRATTP